MKLTKKQREALYAGEPIEHTYPPSENAPLQNGRSYRAGDDLRVLVVRQTPSPEGWTVALLRDRSEPPRLLAQSGGDSEGRGYTSYASRSFHGEGEAVDDETLARFADEGRERFRRFRQEEMQRREDQARFARLRRAQRIARAQDADLNGLTERLDELIEEIEESI